MQRGIDHLVLAVRDLEAARQAYRRFGFTTTPPASHPWGTANSLVQMQGNFLELLAIAEPDRIPEPEPGHFSFGRFVGEFLARREGFAMLVFESADARADREDFLAQGLATYQPFDFERQATLPDGSEATVGFSLAYVTDPRMPEAAFFVCQQHAPEFFWKPEFQAHANGARQVGEVVMVAAEPAALADHFKRLQGPDSTQVGDNAMIVTTARGRISVVSPALYQQRFGGVTVAKAPTTPYLAGFRIDVANLDTAEAALSQNGVPFRRTDGILQISPDEAFGVAIEFVAAD